MAEGKGFEPLIRFRRIHAFQACLFNHSSISPNDFLPKTSVPYEFGNVGLTFQCTNLYFLIDITIIIVR